MSPAGLHEDVQRLLSAYLDDELTQAESQRVRIHVEDCRECSAALEQMRQLRGLTAAVPFPEPPEDRIEELERALSVRAPQQAGWVLIIGGLAAWLVYAVVLAVRRWPPEPGELIAGAIVVGFVLLFVSVLRQRLLALPRDRYRRVRK